MRSDSTREIIKTAITTIGTTRKNFPMGPGTISIGANATQLVRIAKMTGVATSLAPPIAASRRPLPSIRCL